MRCPSAVLCALRLVAVSSSERPAASLRRPKSRGQVRCVRVAHDLRAGNQDLAVHVLPMHCGRLDDVARHFRGASTPSGSPAAGPSSISTTSMTRASLPAATTPSSSLTSQAHTPRPAVPLERTRTVAKLAMWRTCKVSVTAGAGPADGTAEVDRSGSGLVAVRVRGGPGLGEECLDEGQARYWTAGARRLMSGPLR